MKTNRMKTNGIELTKTAMDYLPLFDLSIDTLVNDYRNYNFGDFATRFLLRFAYESGKLLKSEAPVLMEAGVKELVRTANEFSNEIHDKINDHSLDLMGVLSPSCHFLHVLTDVDLMSLHLKVLYPFRAHAKRKEIEYFSECESPELQPCYTTATLDDLFRFCKISLHSLEMNEIAKAYRDIWREFNVVYDMTSFNTSAEYADFADEIGKLIEEGNQSLYDKSDCSWLYKTWHFSSNGEDAFIKSIEQFRESWGTKQDSHLLSAIDLFIHSNTGMCDSQYGSRAVKLLDYHLSLKVPLEELKKAHG